MKPDKPGWWWWRDGSDIGPTTPYRITADMEVYEPSNGARIALKNFTGGHWLGPCHKPGESFTVREIVKYLAYNRHYNMEDVDFSLDLAIKFIKDEKSGIHAVTERNKQ